MSVVTIGGAGLIDGKPSPGGIAYMSKTIPIGQQIIDPRQGTWLNGLTEGFGVYLFHLGSLLFGCCVGVKFKHFGSLISRILCKLVLCRFDLVQPFSGGAWWINGIRHIRPVLDLAPGERVKVMSFSIKGKRTLEGRPNLIENNGSMTRVRLKRLGALYFDSSGTTQQEWQLNEVGLV